MSEHLEEFLIKIGLNPSELKVSGKEADYWERLIRSFSSVRFTCPCKTLDLTFTSYVKNRLLLLALKAAEAGDFAVLEEYSKAYQRVKSVN